MSSTFLYNVTRPAFKPIGDKVCSRTLSSSPCPHRRPYKNIKQMLTGLCQLQALYSSWSLTHLELGCSLSFHRHVIHGMCYVLSVCAKYSIVYWIKKSSLWERLATWASISCCQLHGFSPSSMWMSTDSWWPQIYSFCMLLLEFQVSA